MPITTINGVRLFWEQRGDRGAPLVFVHGSWGDHHNWDAVVPELSRTFPVFTYDRRGHSQSERPSAQGHYEEDVADLAALITSNNLAPAHVASNSGGAIVALKLAAARPDLFASVVAHEPPLVGMIQDHPMMPQVRQRLNAVVDTLKSGDAEAGARLFVETVALGPGTWDTLTPEIRQTFVFNAPTWLDEMSEPESVMAVDLNRLAAFTRPLLLSQGDRSPPFFAVALDRVTAAVPTAKRHTFHGAGHVPHITHPAEYVRVVNAFLQTGRVPAA
jgi:pimeloyl-ACP methyl ester carboxylesterase